MNLVSRVKNILLIPQNEWLIIEQENSSASQVILNYLLILALIPAVSSFIGYGLIGVRIPFIGNTFSIGWGIRQAFVQLITAVAGALLTAFAIDTLAAKFSGIKNINKAIQLVAYSYTPFMLAGIFLVYPAMAVFTTLAGIYGLYLLYLGIGPMMKCPEEKITGYFIACIIVTILIVLILSEVLSSILIGDINGMG